MMDCSLQTQRQWREDFESEKQRIAARKKEAAAIEKMRDGEEKEVKKAEFERNTNMKEGSSVLPDPVLYPIGDGMVQKKITGIPQFELVMRVDIQGKFGKEKNVMAFQNSFGGLPERVMLEITEMMFKSSSSRLRNPLAAASVRMRLRKNQKHKKMHMAVKLPKAIFLSEPKIIRPYMRLMMHRMSELSLEGIQMAGCNSQYYNRMMQASFFHMGLLTASQQQHN